MKLILFLILPVIVFTFISKWYSQTEIVTFNLIFDFFKVLRILKIKFKKRSISFKQLTNIMYRGYDKKLGLYKYISSICKPKNWNQFKGLIWVNKHFVTKSKVHF